jgi:hypothetical protein
VSKMSIMGTPAVQHTTAASQTIPEPATSILLPDLYWQDSVRIACLCSTQCQVKTAASLILLMIS